MLDADHDGLDDVKDRILEFLAVRVLRRERGLGTAASGRGSGAILGLVGPPASARRRWVSRSRARWVVRSCASPSAVCATRPRSVVTGVPTSVRVPGRIVRALTEAKAMNPVVLIDEVDKLQAGGWSGDPSSALLEVLDPAQNHTFRDHYLELDLDLSDVLFLTTANVLDTIPGPLLDRMELVQLDGYTEDEKVAIAKHHLFPRQREKAGLREDELEVTDAALHALVGGWTREAGVRNLERQLGKVARKAARKVAAGDDDDGRRRRADTLNDYVGRPRFHAEDATRAPVPGLATGLAVTGAGGDVLTIEVTGDGRRARSASDRTARRRDVGVGADRAVVRAGERRRSSTCPTGAFDHRRVPPARAVGRDARRTVRRPASR